MVDDDVDTKYLRQKESCGHVTSFIGISVAHPHHQPCGQGCALKYSLTFKILVVAFAIVITAGNP